MFMIKGQFWPLEIFKVLSHVTKKSPKYMFQQTTFQNHKV